MKSNNVIEKIKDVLNLNEEVKLEQAKLDNGTVIGARLSKALYPICSASQESCKSFLQISKFT